MKVLETMWELHALNTTYELLFLPNILQGRQKQDGWGDCGGLSRPTFCGKI